MHYFVLVAETKGQTFRGIPVFYSTSGLFRPSCRREMRSFHYYRYRKIQLCAWASNPADEFPLLPANHVRQSTAHARRLNLKGFISLLVWINPERCGRQGWRAETEPWSVYSHCAPRPSLGAGRTRGTRKKTNCQGMDPAGD